MVSMKIHHRETTLGMDIEKVTCQGVFNLSGEELSKSEKLTLNQGLKYALKKPLNTFQMFIDGYWKGVINDKEYFSIPLAPHTSIIY